MNRLKNIRMYLSSGMDLVPDGGIGWREEITPHLQEFGIVVLNPCDKPTYNGEESPEFRKQRLAAKAAGNYQSVHEQMKDIIRTDLRLIDCCDAVLLYLNLEHHYCGTYHEVFLATQQKKPIIVVCKQGVQNIPCWLFGVLKYQLFFNSFDEALAYLNDIDKAEKVDDLGRWLFFDYDKMYGVNTREE